MNLDILDSWNIREIKNMFKVAPLRKWDISRQLSHSDHSTNRLR